jgi:ribosomal protein S15P/S13E
MQRLKIDLMHMEIKYIEEFLKTNSKDQEAKQRLEYLKKEFADLAQNAIVVD